MPGLALTTNATMIFTTECSLLGGFSKRSKILYYSRPGGRLLSVVKIVATLVVNIRHGDSRQGNFETNEVLDLSKIYQFLRDANATLVIPTLNEDKNLTIITVSDHGYIVGSCTPGKVKCWLVENDQLLLFLQEKTSDLLFGISKMSLNNPELYSLFLPLCLLAMLVTVCSRGSLPTFRVGSKFEEEEEEKEEMDLHVRKNRETSPDRVKVYMQPKMKQYRKVQVLYYLCRNGQLEHPHFMEVSHLATQQLRLKDVMDRLTVLRGKGMPSLFSWSCKRSYKNGYVWNDLAENDVIYPAEGVEYVLKGSEFVEGSSDRFQQLQINSNKRTSKPLLGSSSYAANYNLMKPNQSVVDVDEDMSSSSSGTPKRVEILDSSNRCSRGVSTEEQQNDEIVKNSNPIPTEISLNDGSPPSSSSTVSEKNSDSQSGQQVLEMLPDIRRFKPINRNPFLLQLIACGSMATKGREQSPVFKNIEITKKSLHKSVVSKIAAKAAEEEELDFISENPRFGNLQSEEKEYFSGSIVETTSVNQVSGDPTLKKSNSYNEERGQRSAMAEALAVGSDCSRKGKCIPRRRSSKQLRK